MRFSKSGALFSVVFVLLLRRPHMETVTNTKHAINPISFHILTNFREWLRTSWIPTFIEIIITISILAVSVLTNNKHVFLLNAFKNNCKLFYNWQYVTLLIDVDPIIWWQHNVVIYRIFWLFLNHLCIIYKYIFLIIRKETSSTNHRLKTMLSFTKH